jgi:hypothetical protein
MRFTNLLTSSLGMLVLMFSMNTFADNSVTTTTSSMSADGTTTVVKKTITSPAPKSLSCTTIAAHWDNNIWIDEQSKCKYSGRAEGAEWIQAYWACNAFTDAGDCTNWEYKQGYWVKTAQ